MIMWNTLNPAEKVLMALMVMIINDRSKAVAGH